MKFEQQHFEYIGKLYDVALNPDGWRPVLDEYCTFIGAGGSSLHVMDTINDAATLTNYGGLNTEAILNEYNAIFAAMDTKALSALFLDPHRKFIHDFEMLGMTDIHEIAAHPPIKWLYNKIGSFWRVASRLNVSGAWMDVLTFQFPRDHGPMSVVEKDFSMPFLPHFAKAVEIGRAFRILESRFRAVLDSLDHLNVGVFITLPNGSVVVHNKEAERILSLVDGLNLDAHKCLRLGTEDRNRELSNAMLETSATANGEGENAEILISVDRRSQQLPFLMTVSPLRDDQSQIKQNFRGSLIFVIDPINVSTISANGMEKLFALTSMETDVLRRLLNGAETNEIAEARNTTLGTVRGQIKQVLAKTNTNKRSDLVRLAVSVNLPIDNAKETSGK